MVDPPVPFVANDDEGDERLLIAIASLRIALRDVKRAKVPLAAGFVDLAIHYCTKALRP